jgi:hypothetical protein
MNKNIEYKASKMTKVQLSWNRTWIPPYKENNAYNEEIEFLKILDDI